MRASVFRKAGTEPLVIGGRPAGPRLADYWGWSRSDLLDNFERGALAEFIVAAALGVSTDGARENWAAWDLTTPGGVRVEVKSAAYLQTWAQKRLSRISFGVSETAAWDGGAGVFAGAAQRRAQVYVFALLAHTDKATVNPLDLDQWRFYAVSAALLEERVGRRRSLSLKAVEELAVPARFGELRNEVDRLVRQRVGSASP